MPRTDSLLSSITAELRAHIPFTFAGTLTGIAIMVLFFYVDMPRRAAELLFAAAHPGHVFVSAIATAAMFKLHSKGRLWATLLVGYVGAIAVATLSDSIMPYLGELLLGMSDKNLHPELHLGFIEEWWLVHPLAILGGLVAYYWPRTKVPHATHVLLSTWASLFHMLMMTDRAGSLQPQTALLMPLFLFLAVWLPCCSSDIIFPMLMTTGGCKTSGCPHHHH